MAKKAQAKATAAAPKSVIITNRKKTDKEVRKAIKSIPGFPDLKVHQWMPTLTSLCKLSKAAKTTDHIYRVAYDCCKNARVRRQKKESQIMNQAMTMEVAELVQEQPEGAVLEGEVYV